jgi:histidinol phosphatase-like enzyme
MRGKTSLRALWLAHERFVALLAEQMARLDAVYYSYGHPDGIMRYFSGLSLDRKPSPHNLFVAAARLDLDLSRSWMVGDRNTDVTCARAAGVRAVLVDNRHYPQGGNADIQAKDLAEAALHIMANSA